MPYFTNRGITPLPVGGGGGGYLLDQITPQPTGAFSTRKLKSTATLAFKMTDGAAASPTDVGFDGSDDLDTTVTGNFFTITSGGTACCVRGAYDQSGNGNHLAGNGTHLCVFRAAAYSSGAQQTMNGHPAVLMDNAGTRTSISGATTLKLSSFVTNSAFTVISSSRVSTFGTPGSGVAGGHLFGDGDNGYLGANGLSTYSSVNSAHSYMFDTGNKTTGTAASVDTNYVMVTRLTGGVMSLYVNGGSAVGTPASVGTIGDLTFQNVFLGPGVGTGTSDGWWLDILVYNTALSNADINTLCTASGVTNGNIASRAGVTWTNM